MNRDKVNDVYYGRAASVTQQRRTRDRIHWVCRHVRGAEVLDIGCSQGITCILLGREGVRATGIDHELEAIEDAKKELAQEDPSVQERVTFQYVEATELPFPDASFDSVILAEVIEHLVLPERVLEEARRVLRPGGALVMTIPYGLHEHHDHKDAIYLRPFLDLMNATGFGVEVAELRGPYLQVVATPGATHAPNLLEQMIDVAEKRVRDLDIDLASTRQRRDDWRAKAEANAAAIGELREKLKAEKAKVAKLEKALVKAQNHRAVRLARKAKRIVKPFGRR